MFCGEGSHIFFLFQGDEMGEGSMELDIWRNRDGKSFLGVIVGGEDLPPPHPPKIYESIDGYLG